MMMLKKADDLEHGHKMMAFDAQTVATGMTAVTHASLYSTMAVKEMPIPHQTIIRLYDMKRRMGEKRDLFHDAQIVGFDKYKWEQELVKRFPIDLSEGFKQNLGSSVKTNYSKQNRNFEFRLQQRVTMLQLNSLIGIIESKCPSMHHITTYIKRKVWEELYNINSLHDLKNYILVEIQNIKQLHIRLTW